jgi:aminopeptidase N
MRKLLASLALLTLSSNMYAQDVVFHHELTVSLDPATSKLVVNDTITIPESADLSSLTFSLHDGLSPQSLTDGVTIEQSSDETGAADKGMDQEDYTSVIQSNHYRILTDAGSRSKTLALSYAGEINHPVKQANQEYARGFSQSPGLIDPQGVYLSGSTNWIPSFDEEYVTYKLTVRSPNGWRSVSQGKRTGFAEQDNHQVDTWEVDTPTEEIFVIAAQFTEYEYAMGNVKAMAFLREKDDGLANKYLETTAQYMEMYRGLVGPYPYSKFALVENFWETGYGMPSFTLLGPQIIRFPFILHSSYPHELLHNWWGNGVFVEFETGNWCEGLTAYMADHLIAEQRGTGADYRRATLQGYTDYVTVENEFALKDFLSRSNASSSSIGYGKTAMMWDMLRADVGDENFKRAFQKFYRENKFRRASFDDIRLAFEDVSGKELGPFFDQWVKQAGAPELTINDVQVVKEHDIYNVELELAQIQPGQVYKLSVPVVIYTTDEAKREVAEMDTARQIYTFNLESKPLRLEVDPRFNLMRRLDYREIPPSLSKMFGAEKTLMILPSKAAAAELAKYEQLSSIWKGERGDEFEIKLDSEIKELPTDRSIWVLGWNNLWQSAVETGLKPYDAEIGKTSVRFGTASHNAAENSFVIAMRHPKNPDLALSWLTAHDAEAVAGLARKLPHYGKYSYLGFTGSEPTNSEKGQWPAVGSPLAVNLADYSQTLPQLEKRPALAMLAPVFNASRMEKDIQALADDKMQGRGIGTAGLDAAAEYIAGQFREAGLEPAGDNGSYFQSFKVTGEDGKDLTVRNVLAVIPGTKQDWEAESVVLSAHYDHLGLGWPDAKTGNRGKIHNGADDNASGVAVMLELARTLGKSMEPSRSVVFAAWTAEEAGLLGARHYVNNMQRYPAKKAMGNLNIDTVGHLEENKLLVLGSTSANEWKFIFMGASFVTGVQTEMPTQDIDSSDQVAFIEAGVPAVQFFSGASPDYHQPGDTVDKLDFNGLVKVAAIVREGVEYLAERPEPMAFKGSTKKPGETKPTGGERRASTGLMPDFAFSGKGVSIGAVGDDTPAKNAGLLKGDVITAINGTKVENLRAYSDMLKKLAPGDVIDVTYTRDGTEQNTSLTLKAR